MVMAVSTNEEILLRREKVRRKIANIKNQSILEAVLNSFPEAMKREVYDELAPSLRFESSFPEEDH